ncbi:MAG: hypothetical protein KatS3mg009_2473 [Acidimicrobiia bacterium]|nr:MAG: hypothetical protein KatS3mg009_2473 [Acidimicrobiia bacterium]
MSSDTVTGTGERLRNLEEARNLVAVTAKDIRTAVRLEAGTSPFVLADDREAIFYANLDTTDAPKKVRIRVDGQNQLIEEVWDADAGSVAPDYTYTGTARVRYVGRFVANDVDTPIFEYLDDDGNVLASTPRSVSASDRLAVKSVRITLEVRRTSAFNDNVTTVVNQVRLPNLDYNAVAG